MTSLHRRLIVLALLTLSSLTAWAALAQTTASAPQAPTFACADVEEIPFAECQALVDLYQATNGPQWPIQGSWLVTSTPCTTPWRGVACAGGHVVSLDRSTNNLDGLVGPLPASLANLTELRVLKLAGNELRGPIPPALGALSNLQTLDLANNQLTGTIPAELGNLADLRILLLGNNRLTGTIPAELGNLAQLEQLGLTTNTLSGAIPAELGRLSQLRDLRLGGNQLSGSIPSTLGDLTELRVLNLSQNQLDGAMPAALGQLTRLESLWLDRNRLEGTIPPELGNLASLRLLALSRNRLSGPLPSELGALSMLQELWVTSNQLEGAIPEALCELKNLFDFDVSFNALSAAPSCLTALDPSWASTQTVAPTDLQAAADPTGTVALTWTPILYVADSGYYEISYARQGSPFTVHGVTADKHTSTYTMEGLAPGVYNVRVRTFTAAHDEVPAFQPNDIWSAYTLPVSVVVGDPTPVTWTLHFPQIEVQSPGH